MHRKALLLLAIGILARPALGRPLDPAGPGVIASAKALPTSAQALGPVSLWLQFASLFLDVATVSARPAPAQSGGNDTAISNRVVDAAGRPIRGARIWFLDAPVLSNRLEAIPYTLSDEEGRFRVSDADDRGGVLVVEATGFRMSRTWMDSPSREVQVTLQRPDQVCTYRVWVVDESGQPLANAPVSLVVTGDPRGPERHEARTDATGQATFFWQAPDAKDRTGSFGCDLAGYDLAFACAKLSGDEPLFGRPARPGDLGLRLVLHPCGQQRQGVVCDPQGRPIAGAEVHLVGMSQSVEPSPEKGHRWVNAWQSAEEVDHLWAAKTDSYGRFVLRRFSPCDYLDLAVQAPGFGSRRVSIDPGTSRLPNITLQPAAHHLRLQVIRQDGRKRPDVWEIRLVGPGGTYRDAVDPNGTAVLEDVAPGEYVPSLISNQYREDRRTVCALRPIVVRPGQEQSVLVEVREGIPVKGQMVDAESGRFSMRNKASLTATLAGTEVFVNCADVNDDGTWELYLPEGTFDLSYSFVVDGLNPFCVTTRPQPVTVHVDRRSRRENWVLRVDPQAMLAAGRPLSHSLVTTP